MKKFILFSLLLLVCTLFAQDGNVTTVVSNFNEGQALTLYKGQTILVPFTGFLFGIESTKRLLKNDTDAILLRNEVEILKRKLEIEKSITESLQLQLDVTKKYATLSNKQEIKLNVEKSFMLIGGFLVGVVATVGTYSLARVTIK